VKYRARTILVASLVSAGPLAVSGCSGGATSVSAKGSGGASGAAGDGSGGATASGGSGGAAPGMAGASGGSGSRGGAGGGYPNVGVCGRRGQATADPTSFVGYEERYLIGEQGFGTDICAVRFDLTRVGDAPAGCSECVWTQLLEYGKANVATDAGGACAGSDLALTQGALAKITGSRVAIGFARQLGGAHGSARMTYNEATATWDVTGNATWNETSKAFKFDYREGVCNYGP
jgi:hypothetical protein